MGLVTGQMFVGKVVSVGDSVKVDKFVREIDALNKCAGHPNVIRLYRYRVIGSFGFMLLELGEQGALNNFIENNKDLYKEPRLVLQMFLGLLEGVNFIHSKDLVHTDLKTRNVVVSRNKVLKVIDFDLVRENGWSGGKQGTPLYMDPMNVQNTKQPYTPYTDIHALGIILYEMVHQGSMPYKGFGIDNLFDNIVGGKYNIAKGTHWLIAYLIVKCLSTSPKHRLTISDMIKLIKQQIGYVSRTLSPEHGFAGGKIDSSKDYHPESFFPAQKEDTVVEVYYIDKYGRKYTKEHY